MILPKNQPVHENLNTSFTNFDQLLSDLRANQFTGYVNLNAWKYEGILFVDSGNLVNVVEETEGKRRTGLGALESLRARAREKDGAIGVYRLDGDLVALLAGSAQRSALYEQLSTDLTTFARLIAKLQKESLTGHVEVQLPDKSSGMIFLEKGATISSFYSVNGATLMGDTAIEKLANSSNEGATFNVYRSDATASIGQDFVKLELIHAWQNLLALFESKVDQATSKGTFASEFKRGCLDNLKEYPFLDPFAGGFEFKDGQIHFEGGANNALFTTGVASVLKSAALRFDSRGSAAVQDAMRTAAQTQREALETWGIAAALAPFFTKDIPEFGATNLDNKPSLYERVISETKPFLADKSEAFIERQCRQHLGIAPQALADEHLSKLAQQVETAASLMISKQDALALRKKIDALSTRRT